MLTRSSDPATFQNEPMISRSLCAATVAIALAVAACSQATEPTPSQALMVVVNVFEAGVGTENYAGQSLTIPRGTYSRIRFNWYDFQGNPTAFGGLYVLTSEFLGQPGHLAGAAAMIARSTHIENDEYVLPADLVLKGPAKYWFYTEQIGRYVTSFDRDIYPGGDFYICNIASLPFRKLFAAGHENQLPPVFQDANFRLRATHIWP